MSPQSKYWGDVSPCPIGIDAPAAIHRRYWDFFTVRAAATDCIVFDWVFFLTHKPLHLARWHSAGTCTLTTARILFVFKVIGQRSRSQDRIFGLFTTARYRKKFVDTKTHEPLNSAWSYFVRIHILTTSRTLLNFKVIGQSQGHMGFGCFSLWMMLLLPANSTEPWARFHHLVLYIYMHFFYFLLPIFSK